MGHAVGYIPMTLFMHGGVGITPRGENFIRIAPLYLNNLLNGSLKIDVENKVVIKNKYYTKHNTAYSGTS